MNQVSNEKLLKDIALILTGINVEDLTHAEVKICRRLKIAGYLALVSHEGETFYVLAEAVHKYKKEEA